MSWITSLFNNNKATKKPAATPVPAATQTPSYLQSGLTESGTVDPNALAKRTTQAISNMNVPDQSATISSAQKAVSALAVKDQYGKAQESPEQKIGQAAIDAFKGQVKAAQQQAENSAMSLQTKSEMAQSYLSSVQKLSTDADTASAEMAAAWQKVSDLGPQYIKDAADHMNEITSTILNLTKQTVQRNDLGAADAVVANVTGMLESNKGYERGIIERYGLDSPQMQAYQDSKRISIGVVVSDLMSKANERAVSILNAGTQAYTEAATALATNVNWVRQKTMETATNVLSSMQSWKLSMAAYKATFSSFKGTPVEDLTNALDASTVFAADATPLLSLLGELKETQQTRIATENTTKRQSRQQALQESYAMGLNGWGVY